jgi:hypothetical protein
MLLKRETICVGAVMPQESSVWSGFSQILPADFAIGSHDREGVVDMSVITPPPHGPTTLPDGFPALYRLNVAQYDRMTQDGTIGEHERVELVEGLLVTKMGKNPPRIFAGKLGLKPIPYNES